MSVRDDVTSSGRLFHVLAAAMGNMRSPMVRSRGLHCHWFPLYLTLAYLCVSSCRCSTCQHIRMVAESFSESWNTVCRSRHLDCWRRCMSTRNDCCTTSTATTLYSTYWSMAGPRTAAALWRRSVAKFSH